MSGRESAAVEAALRTLKRGGTITAAAVKHGVDVSTLRRALRRRGILPRARTGRPPKANAP